MCVVIIKDGTICFVDTSDEYTARSVVAHKMHDTIGVRGIASSVYIEKKLDKESKYYNSPDMRDGVPLRYFRLET